MLTHRDIVDWLEIQRGLDRHAENEWQRECVWKFYERRRREISDQIAGGIAEVG